MAQKGKCAVLITGIVQPNIIIDYNSNFKGYVKTRIDLILK